MGSPFTVRSLLLPLVLLLLPVGSHSQLKFRVNPQEKRNVRPSDKVHLQCEILSDSQTGCSWLRLAPRAVVPTFLLYISGSSSSVKLADGLDPKRFQGERASSSMYRLMLNDFREEDQGYYYCVATRNAAFFFSPFVPVFLPVKATTTPAPKTTTLLATTKKISSVSENCKPIFPPQEKKGLDFSCDLYIWMPLTGVCVILLLALITTITICQSNSLRLNFRDLVICNGKGIFLTWEGRENESADVRESRHQRFRAQREYKGYRVQSSSLTDEETDDGG